MSGKNELGPVAEVRERQRKTRANMRRLAFFMEASGNMEDLVNVLRNAAPDMPSEDLTERAKQAIEHVETAVELLHELEAGLKLSLRDFFAGGK